VSLRTRLTLFFVGIVVLPLLAATVAFQALSSRQADTRADTRLRTGARALAAFWEERLSVVEREVILAAERVAPHISEPRLPARVKAARSGSGLDFLIVAEEGGGVRAADLLPAQYVPGRPTPSPEVLAAEPEPPAVLRTSLKILHEETSSVVVGGRYADASLATELKNMTGFDVAVVSGGEILAAAGPVPPFTPRPGVQSESEGHRSLFVPIGHPGRG